MVGWILYRLRESELTERDYSVRRLLDEAASYDVDLRIITPQQLQFIVTSQSTRTLLCDGEPVSLPDFVLPRMGAHTSGFALSLLRYFDIQGVYCCNTAAAIQTAMDKLWTGQVLLQHHLPVPKTLAVRYPVDIELIRQEFGFPLVLKNVSAMSGDGVTLCETEHACVDMIQFLYSCDRNLNLLIQEYIKASAGSDLRVFVLGGRVVSAVKRAAAHGFKANVSLGATVTDFPLTPEIESLAVQAAECLGLDIAGVDLLFTDTGYTICEVNSSPGFSGLEQVFGPIMVSEILSYIKYKAKQKRAGKSSKLTAL